MTSVMPGGGPLEGGGAVITGRLGVNPASERFCADSRSATLLADATDSL